MSFERNECTECGSVDTERQDVEWLTDVVLEIRTCNDCPTQYFITWSNPVAQTDEVEA